MNIAGALVLTNDILSKKFHVVSANVASDLVEVYELANSISLEAMNAKVLVARSGDKALGFRPITDFMVEMSDETIRLVEAINIEALLVSRLSVKLIRASIRTKHLELAQVRSMGAIYENSIQNLLAVSAKGEEHMARQLEKHTVQLIKLLDDINSHMIAAQIMSGTSRIEAASVDVRYRTNFQSVSTKLDEASKGIRRRVVENKKYLLRTLEH